MKNDVTLVILMPPGDDKKGSSGSDLYGLSLIDRNLHAAERSGMARVVIIGTPGTVLHVAEVGIPVEMVEAGTLCLNSIAGTVIVMAGHALADTKWLSGIIAASAVSGGCMVEPDVIAALASDAEGDWRDRPVAPGGPDAFFTILDQSKCRSFPPDREGRFIMESSRDVVAAENWLLQRLIKSGDSFMARTINRPLSLAITRRLARTDVTPNQITIISVLIGLMGALFFLSMDPMIQTTGAFILLIHNVVDGCDGELARLKFQSSRMGLILDMWGDNLVHAVLFACMGIGWSFHSGMTWPLVVAGIAVVGTLWTAWLVFRRTMRSAEPGRVPQFLSVAENVDTKLSRILRNLGNRDFFFGIFALSLFGKGQWLLPLVAMGSVLYAIGLIVLNRREQ